MSIQEPPPGTNQIYIATAVKNTQVQGNQLYTGNGSMRFPSLVYQMTPPLTGFISILHIKTAVFHGL